ncbi:MAG TPA: hypothetical protein VI136_00430 [Verrucomicrobiae bacterium]
MTILTISAVLATIAALGWAGFALNRHCLARHGFRLFNLWLFIPVVVGYLLVGVAAAMGSGENLTASVVVLLVITAALAWYVKSKTSPRITLAVVPLVHCYGVAALAGLAVAIPLVLSALAIRSFFRGPTYRVRLS